MGPQKHIFGLGPRLSLRGPVQEKYCFYNGHGRTDLEFIVGGVVIGMIIDSGSDVNIISEIDWEQMKRKGIKITNATVGGTEKILKGYASKVAMQIKGSFNSKIEIGKNIEDAVFYVIKDGQQSLLGRVTSEKLKVLKVGMINAIGKEDRKLPKIKGIQKKNKR